LTGHAGVAGGAVSLTEHATGTVLFGLVAAVDLAIITGTGADGAIVLVIALEWGPPTHQISWDAVWITGVTIIALIGCGAAVGVVAEVSMVPPGAFNALFRITATDLAWVGVQVDGSSPGAITRGVAGGSFNARIALAAAPDGRRWIHATGTLHAIQSAGVAVVTAFNITGQLTSALASTGHRPQTPHHQKKMHKLHTNPAQPKRRKSLARYHRIGKGAHLKSKFHPQGFPSGVSTCLLRNQWASGRLATKIGLGYTAASRMNFGGWYAVGIGSLVGLLFGLCQLYHHPSLLRGVQPV
jgi:hypothetical protein